MVMHNKDEQDLSMFFGRNSSFSIISPEEYSEYKIGIIADGNNHQIRQKCEHLFLINPQNEKINITEPNVTIIKADMLFGEWMPMNEHGIHNNNKIIPFTSDYFRKQAIYINDFTSGFLQWMKLPELPSIMYVHTKNSSTNSDIKLEKNVFLRENIANEQNVKSVIDHYRLYRKI